MSRVSLVSSLASVRNMNRTSMPGPVHAFPSDGFNYGIGLGRHGCHAQSGRRIRGRVIRRDGARTVDGIADVVTRNSLYLSGRLQLRLRYSPTGPRNAHALYPLGLIGPRGRTGEHSAWRVI